MPLISHYGKAGFLMTQLNCEHSSVEMLLSSNGSVKNDKFLAPTV